MRASLRRVMWMAVVLQAAAAAYLSALTAIALTDRRHSGVKPSACRLQLAVVIPAHDEEAMLSGTLSALRQQTYPRDRFAIHVIADNCRDRTAAIARELGAEVHERDDPARPGKGQALAWLLPQLLERDADAFVFLDADSTVEPQFLQVLACHMQGGAHALQAGYRVADPDTSPLVALRALAFTLMHEVRGRAKARLGVSCGLWGNGMALHRDILSDIGWHSFTSVEDAEQHLRLVLSGVDVAFVPRARVFGHMPSTYRDAGDQQRRWEAGRLNLLRAWWLPLLRSAVLSRNRSAAVALCELALPPLSVLGLTSVAVMTGALLSRSAAARLLALASSAGLAAHVLSGLAITGMKPRSYLVLLEVPRFALWKLRLYAREVVRGKDAAWVRTSRTPRA